MGVLTRAQRALLVLYEAMLLKDKNDAANNAANVEPRSHDGGFWGFIDQELRKSRKMFGDQPPEQRAASLAL